MKKVLSIVGVIFITAFSEKKTNNSDFGDLLKVDSGLTDFSAQNSTEGFKYWYGGFPSPSSTTQNGVDFIFLQNHFRILFMISCLW